MQKFARFISLCLLIVFATDSFAKGIDPIRHASGSAEARLALDVFKGKVLDKFSGLSVSHQESVLYGMYRMGVKAQNKLQKMDAEKIADKLNARAQSEDAAQAAMTNDEEAASEFISDSVVAEEVQPTIISASQISGILNASGEAIASVGTALDVNGKFKRLSRADFLKSVRQELTGDGDWEGAGEALAAFFVAIFVLLAVAAVVIVGLATVAFGLPGAAVSIVVLGIIVLVTLR